MRFKQSVVSAILGGFSVGGLLFGVWLTATEPDVGLIAFLPGTALGLIWAVNYGIDVRFAQEQKE